MDMPREREREREPPRGGDAYGRPPPSYGGGYDDRDRYGGGRGGYDDRDRYGGGGYGAPRGGYDDRDRYGGGRGGYDDRERYGAPPPPGRSSAPGALRTDFRLIVTGLGKASWQDLKDFGRRACRM
jgi:hypothetical protein